ncbi:MAG: hypothetical protein IJ799_06940 [Bacteroidales bacterium]|nr:hypothetical protein [Bacteroidales bacterium]
MASVVLEDIRRSFARLIALYEGEKQRNEVLAGRLSESEAAVETYRKQIEELTRQIDNLKLSGAFNPSSNREARARLDALIAEIDRCIGFLENQ